VCMVQCRALSCSGPCIQAPRGVWVCGCVVVGGGGWRQHRLRDSLAEDFQMRGVCLLLWPARMGASPLMGSQGSKPLLLENCDVL
jgi:hypothetical protein